MTCLGWVYKAFDAWGNVEFVAQKLGISEDIAKYLAPSRGFDFFVYLSIPITLGLFLFQVNRLLQKQAIIAERDSTENKPQIVTKLPLPPPSPSVKVTAKTVRYCSENNGVLMRFAPNSGFSPHGDMCLSTFQLLITEQRSNAIWFKAILNFEDLENEDSEPLVIEKGIWLDVEKEEVRVKPSEFFNLVVGYKNNKHLSAYEHHSVAPLIRAIERSRVLTPKHIRLSSNAYEVTVQLIGRHNNNIVLNEKFLFEFALKDDELIFCQKQVSDTPNSEHDNESRRKDRAELPKAFGRKNA